MEMSIAILMASVVLGTATTVVANVATLNGTIDRQVTAQETARVAVDTLSTQLRNAIGPPGQSPIYYPIASTADPTEVVFYAPDPSASTTNNPRGLQWVRYCLDYSNLASETLWMQAAPYDSTQAGPPSRTTCPNAAWTKKQAVATNLVNRTTTPVTTLFTQSADAGGVIHDIQVRLLVQGDSKRKTTPVTSSIDFRNAKSAPNAVVTCQVQNRHALCDASKSTDPDGEALSFKWGRVCCSPSYTTSDTRFETGQTSYLYDSGTLSSGTYNVYVRVGDASGLTTDASAAVTIP
jgi:Tfp pilus assembly protein PilW